MKALPLHHILFAHLVLDLIRRQRLFLYTTIWPHHQHLATASRHQKSRSGASLNLLLYDFYLHSRCKISHNKGCVNAQLQALLWLQSGTMSKHVLLSRMLGLLLRTKHLLPELPWSPLLFTSGQHRIRSLYTGLYILKKIKCFFHPCLSVVACCL